MTIWQTEPVLTSEAEVYIKEIAQAVQPYIDELKAKEVSIDQIATLVGTAISHALNLQANVG